jgi:hypothetical protein
MSLQNLCEESEKTRRAREKLRKRLKQLEQKITQDALKRKIIEIHDRISRHAPDRVPTKKNNISLFDNNQSSKEISRKVCAFREKIVSIFEEVKENNAMFLKPHKASLKKYEINIIE